MVSTHFYGPLCLTIMILVAFSSTVIEVKTFPQRQLAAESYKSNHSSFDNTLLFSYNSLENDLRWIVPRFPSNHHDNITFCRNKQTIRMPVWSDTNVITIPCWTTFLGFQDGTGIMLYKVRCIINQ